MPKAGSQKKMKVVGKRKPARGWEAFDRLQKMAIQLRGDKPFFPKGVYRFKSHEEAQEWSLQMLTRKRNPARRR